MNSTRALSALFPHSKPIIGMVHVLPLPGTPYFGGSIEAIIERALSDARALEKGGADGILIQNRGDRTYAKDRSAPEAVACMALVGAAVKQAVNLPVGFHLLRNDVLGSLALAATCRGTFIRVGCGIGATYLPQGIVEADPSAVLTTRARLGLQNLLMFSDVDSFHYRPLVPTPPESVAAELRELNLADAAVIADSDIRRMVAKIGAIKTRNPDLPVFVGGYATLENIVELLQDADGAIVGGAFEEGGRNGPVDVDKVRRFIDRIAR